MFQHLQIVNWFRSTILEVSYDTYKQKPRSKQLKKSCNHSLEDKNMMQTNDIQTFLFSCMAFEAEIHKVRLKLLLRKAKECNVYTYNRTLTSYLCCLVYITVNILIAQLNNPSHLFQTQTI